MKTCLFTNPIFFKNNFFPKKIGLPQSTQLQKFQDFYKNINFYNSQSTILYMPVYQSHAAPQRIYPHLPSGGIPRGDKFYAPPSLNVQFVNVQYL